MNLKNRFLSYSGSVCGGDSTVCDDIDDGASYPPRSCRLTKMGQIPSTSNSPNQIASTSGGSNSRRRSFRSPFVRRKKQKHPLSAAFQAPNCNGFEALNINAASVEQFMTLPGINRQIATSIVDHRYAIGGRFQRVDDLALVSGIGAERLEKIRPEVCIKRMSRSVNGTCTPSRSMISSRTPSLDSVFSEPTASQLQMPKTIINVNTSSVFQLQQLSGMNQELAAKLVDYRNRKGPFKSLDDLVKVKGLSHARLGAIRSGLCIQDIDIPKTPKFKHASSMSTCPTSTPIKNGYNRNNNDYNNVGHRKSISMPIQMNGSAAISNGFSNVPINDIFDLLGAYSHRPIVEDNYNNTRNGHSTIRLASWNLNRMCLEKSSNLGVKEVICRTILENRLSIVCIQEIIDPLALHDLCDELNRPRLRRVAEWKPNNRNWKYAMNASCADGQLNGLGFIYDADRCDLMRDTCLDISLDDCVDLTDSAVVAPSAYLAAFRFADWTCQVLNTYLRYYDLAKLDRIISAVELQLRTHQTAQTLNDIFAVAGDFSDTSLEAEAPRYLKKRCKSPLARTPGAIDLQHMGLFNVVEPNSTAFSQPEKPPSGANGTVEKPRSSQPSQRPVLSSCNILCRERMPSTRSAFREALYKTKSPLTIYDDLQQNGGDATAAPQVGDRLCGYYGVLRQGLCHMAIPHEWRWGGSVSEHCPVWIEMYKCRDRSQPARNTSIEVDNDESAAENRTPSAAVRRQIYQRRSSVNSNVSYHRMNGNTISGGGGRNYLQNQSMPVPGVLLSNGQLLNASSDSVFLDN